MHSSICSIRHISSELRMCSHEYEKAPFHNDTSGRLELYFSARSRWSNSRGRFRRRADSEAEWNEYRLEVLDSDISVYFADADVFHVGDTFWNGYYPFIDYSTGGSIDGMIRATEANLAKA